MSEITRSLIDERSDIFNGWSVVGVGVFELGGGDMSNFSKETVLKTVAELFDMVKGQQQQLELLKTQAIADATEIDSLKAQLNNMECCYIEIKKERDDALFLKVEHRKRRCELSKELTRKSLRLTDAEFEYKRIKELQAKDCLKIMRLTARNEKLSDELKALRGATCQ